MSSRRRHSISGDDHHYRGRRDHEYDSAYYSREEDNDFDRYHRDRRGRRESSHGQPVTTSRRHSPDVHHRHRSSRGRSRHDDDYDPRDKYYLSDEEDIGFRSKSAQPQRTPWDESPPKTRRRGGDQDDEDYFSRRHRSTAGDRRDRSSHRDDRSRSHRSRHREPHDEYDSSHHHDSDRRSGGRRGAPEMLRRHSSSAPPPTSRSKYPPSSGRQGRSRYPPSTTETRGYGGGSHRSSSRHDGDRGRRSKSSHDHDHDRTSRSKSKAKKISPFSDVPWSQAARCALEAGTMAALRSYDKPGNWIGTKGAQIATAAVGAALVDGVIASKKPNLRGGKRHAVLRQVTNTALGNLVMNPAGRTVEQKEPVNRTKHAIQSRLRHGGSRRR